MILANHLPGRSYRTILRESNEFRKGRPAKIFLGGIQMAEFAVKIPYTFERSNAAQETMGESYQNDLPFHKDS